VQLAALVEGGAHDGQHPLLPLDGDLDAVRRLGRGAGGLWRELARGATTPDGAISVTVPAGDVTALRLRVGGASSGIVRAPRREAPAPKAPGGPGEPTEIILPSG